MTSFTNNYNEYFITSSFSRDKVCQHSFRSAPFHSILSGVSESGQTVRSRPLFQPLLYRNRQLSSSITYYTIFLFLYWRSYVSSRYLYHFAEHYWIVSSTYTFYRSVGVSSSHGCTVCFVSILSIDDLTLSSRFNTLTIFRRYFLRNSEM